MEAQVDPTPAPASCPVLVDGETVLDGDAGVLYRVENGALRQYPNMEVYKSWGSPSYRPLPGVQLAACSKAPPMEARDPQTTEPAAQEEYDGNVYAFVHAGAWMNDGVLRVASSRFSGLMLEPFKFRDAAQAWAISTTGHIRSVNAPGLYLDTLDTCLSPVLNDTKGDPWSIVPSQTGDTLRYVVKAECGNVLLASPEDRAVSLGQADRDNGEWFLVPVGRLST